MDETPEERAARRRSTWTGGRVQPHEAAAADLAFWRSATPEQRVEATWAMAEEAWHLEGHVGPLPRLQRTVWGVRRR